MPHFSCDPRENLGAKAATVLADHPVSIYVREEALADCLSQFFAEWLFGRDRRARLEAHLRLLENQDDRERHRRVQSLGRAIAESERRI